MPENRNHEQNTEKQSTSQGGPTSNTQDLKEREYRDSQGNVHHHTHTSSEMKDDKAA